MKRTVVFAPEAQDDLLALYSYIAERSGPTRAIGFVSRIESYCLGFEVAGERGTRRAIYGRVCALSGSSVA
jgi:toxin ParE1/3/4